MRLIEFFNLTEQEEVLYHGSDYPNLETYDLRKARTAQHIYTSPEPGAARAYGKYLYRAIPVQGLKYFTMMPDDMGPDEYKVLRQVYADLKEDWFDTGEVEWDDEADEWAEVDSGGGFDEFMELVTSSKVYDYDSKGRFQDELLGTINYYGFDVVIFADATHGRGWAPSYVFFNPAHLKFVPVEQPLQDAADGNQHDLGWRADWNTWGTHGMGMNGMSKPFSISPEEPGILPPDIKPIAPERMAVQKKS